MERVRHGRWLGIVLWVALGTGCGWDDVVGSGQLVTEQRQISDFTELVVNDSLDATVVVDDSVPAQVRLVGDDNLVGRIQTEMVDSSTLRVRFGEELRWTSPNALRVEVTVPRLEALSRSGGGNVELSGHIAAPTLRLTTSGGGSIRARGLNAQTLILETSGGAFVYLEGKAAQVTSHVSGGGELSARELYTYDASLTSSGGGSTVLRVSDSLKVTASGGSAVRIVGQPSLVSSQLSGGASLTIE